jgi:tetratricopeptide (TPR) repeat protein
MSKIDWRKTLSWGDEQVEDIRVAGFSYIRQGKYDIALPFFEALIILDPESSYDAQTLGALYLQVGKWDKAFRYLERALILEADHAPTLLNLCKAMLMLGRKQEALKLAKLLSREKDPRIANVAKALMLAYG